MNRLTIPSALLLAMSTAATPMARASAPQSTQTARSVTPAIQPLQQTQQKSGTAVAVKPPLPPRRPGPVLELGATLSGDGVLQLHCDQHDLPPLPVGDGGQP